MVAYDWLAAQLAAEHNLEYSDVLPRVMRVVDPIAEEWGEHAEFFSDEMADEVRDEMKPYLEALEELVTAQADVAKHESQLVRRDEAIRRAIGDPARVDAVQLAKLTSLTRARIYQIRDDRR